ncbi:MAG: FAD-dependent thymidylate synthase [Candidatus Paceibacterota bacterium]|jgi:thymidylate synthase (FAD)
MKIKLIASTPNPEKIVYLAARQSRYADGVGDIPKKEITDQKVKDLIKKLLEWGHFGPFEHPHFTFVLSEVSRAFTHQLVRHRMATYDQQSLRYVNKSGRNLETAFPQKISSQNKKAIEEFNRQSITLYEKLVKDGVPAEDARFVLPIGTKTAIVMTMNARSMMHFLKLRLDKSAQWEIREGAKEILKIMKKEMPTTFGWFAKNWEKLKLTP